MMRVAILLEFKNSMIMSGRNINTNSNRVDDIS